jgi:hypothetical protein
VRAWHKTTECFLLTHCRGDGARTRRRRGDRRPGRRDRRPEPVRQRRQAEVLLQLLWSGAVLRGGHHRDPVRHPPGPDEFAYDGGGLGKGGTATLYIDGEAAGEGRIEQTEAFLFSADETLDVGNEYGSTDDGQRKFNGKVNWVEIDVGLGDHNHLIKPEDRLNLAMAIQ